MVALASRRSGHLNYLYFAAKAPLAGEAKTRLGSSIGMNAAATLYFAFLRDIAERFVSTKFRTGWCIAPGSKPHLAPLIRSTARVRVQRGDSWAERQANLFRDCAAEGEMRVVLAATDSPQLPHPRLEEAFAALDANDVVLGPTHDGGYYLIGMRGFHDVLEGVEMSTTSALDEVRERAGSQGISVALLEPEFDVDAADDLIRLSEEVSRRDDLAHTAAALAVILGVEQESRIA